MTRTPRRSGEAVAAQHRNAGPMKHRNTPRGGANNLLQDLLDQAYDEGYQDGLLDGVSAEKDDDK